MARQGKARFGQFKKPGLVRYGLAWQGEARFGQNFLNDRKGHFKRNDRNL